MNKPAQQVNLKAMTIRRGGELLKISFYGSGFMAIKGRVSIGKDQA
jgi:hypothetical protein